jgi:hypothetical protein
MTSSVNRNFFIDLVSLVIGMWFWSLANAAPALVAI